MSVRVSVVLLAALAVSAAVQSPRAQAPTRPNVVLILTDDMGCADLGSYGATDIRTPHIDSLARDGVRITDFYSNGVCLLADARGADRGPLSAAVRARGAAAAVRGRRRRERGLVARGPFVAAVARDSAATPPRWSASGTSATAAGVSPARARLRRTSSA